jgi:hypothetical protein
MKQPAICVLIVLLLAACGDKNSTSVPWVNVCEDLTWLDSIKGTVKANGWQAEIYLTHYQNERVFEVNACLNCADFPTTVHDCEGTVICEFGGLAGVNTCPDYAPAQENKLLFWKSD